MKLQISPDKPLTLFVRIKGPNCVREFRAIIDTGSDLCVIPKEDLHDMGIDASFDPMCDHVSTNYRICNSCYFEAESVMLDKVMIGDIEASNVEFLVLTLPRDGGIDVILGRSFLKNFKTTVDYKSGYLTIE